MSTFATRILAKAREKLASWTAADETGRASARAAYRAYCQASSKANWCACFVSRILGDVTDHTTPRSPGARAMARKLIAAGWREREPNELPQPGDVIYFWRGRAHPAHPNKPAPDEWRGHIGFVDSASPSMVVTIEGNSSNAVRRRVYSTAPQFVPKVLGYLAPPEEWRP